jgi:hypothetical protein
MKFCVGIVFICGSWVFFTSLLLGGGFQVLTNTRATVLAPSWSWRIRAATSASALITFD